MKKSTLLFTIVLTMLTLGCQLYRFDNSTSTLGYKMDRVDNWTTLKKLYESYKDGEINECKYNGETVYSAGLNAYDAGGQFYDVKGNTIGTCNFAMGEVDSICRKAQDCEVIYRCDKHITGLAAVDKYGLGQ